MVLAGADAEEGAPLVEAVAEDALDPYADEEADGAVPRCADVAPRAGAAEGAADVDAYAVAAYAAVQALVGAGGGRYPLVVRAPDGVGDAVDGVAGEGRPAGAEVWHPTLDPAGALSVVEHLAAAPFGVAAGTTSVHLVGRAVACCPDEAYRRAGAVVPVGACRVDGVEGYAAGVP